MTTKLAKDLEVGDTYGDFTVTSAPEEYEGKFGPEVRFDVRSSDGASRGTFARRADDEVVLDG